MKKEVIFEHLDDPESFVWSVIRKKKYGKIVQNWNFMDEEDLYQEGWVALLQAAKNYDASQGKDFAWYAFYWILERLGRIINNNKKKDEKETSWEKEYEIPDEVEDPDSLDEIKKELNEEDKEIIKLTVEGYTQDEIGEMLGIPQQTVSYKINKIYKDF